MDLNRLPGPLLQTLLPFQKEGVRFAVQKDGRCLIADEMGLGKTLQAISVACMYRDEWPLLVIVPSCVKFCWIEEFEKWLPDLLPQDINLIQSGTDASGIATAPISIVTYGLLRSVSAKLVQETIKGRKFQVVICDESHYLKNAKTLSSKIIVPIIKLAKRRILLSGTPALARPVELYPQLDAVCPGQWGSFWNFTEQYCEPRYLHYGGKRQRKADGASNLEELQQRMSGMLMIRREKSQVLTELPPKQRQRVLFELKDSSLKQEITKKFDTLRQNVRKSGRTLQQLVGATSVDCGVAGDGGGGPDHGQQQSDAEAAAATDGDVAVTADPKDDDGRLDVFRDVSKLYRVSGEAKIGPVREYIEMLCENQKLKFLVFAYHHNMMDGVEHTLHSKKVRYVRIDGHTKPVERQAFVSQFQSDPSTRVAILSILAAGVGLTLTAAKLVVFAELYWTPGVMVQCEDRAHRIGQTDPLSVHYLVAKNTMDEWVWASVCRKTVVTSAALSGKCRQLEHLEGDQYQIDVLSKADVTTHQQIKKVDAEEVSQLIMSQRPRDQPSIQDFFSSPNNSCNSTNGKRKGVVGVSGACANSGMKSSHLTAFGAIRYASPATKMKATNRNLDNSLIVIDSDEEEEFEPARKRRKKIKGSRSSVPSKEDECENERQVCDSFSELHNKNVENASDAFDMSPPQKLKGREKNMTDSDDLFSDKNSSDSDSDSLPDVYLGTNWEKTKLQQKCNADDSKKLCGDESESFRDISNYAQSACDGNSSTEVSNAVGSSNQILPEDRLPSPMHTGENVSKEIIEANLEKEKGQGFENEENTGFSYSKKSTDTNTSSPFKENLLSSSDYSPAKIKSSIGIVRCELLLHTKHEGSGGQEDEKESFAEEEEKTVAKVEKKICANHFNITPETQRKEEEELKNMLDHDKMSSYCSSDSCSVTPLPTCISTPRKYCGSDPNQWPCSKCTFLNHQDLVCCEICNTPQKHRTRSQSEVNPNTAGKQKPAACSSHNNLQLPLAIASDSSKNGKECCDVTVVGMLDVESTKPHSSVINGTTPSTLPPKNANHNKHSVCCSNGPERGADFSSDVDNNEVTAVHCTQTRNEMDCVGNVDTEVEEGAEAGSSVCNDIVSDCQSEEGFDEDDYENDIENFESDEDMGMKTNSENENAWNRNDEDDVIENSCSDSDKDMVLKNGENESSLEKDCEDDMIENSCSDAEENEEREDLNHVTNQASGKFCDKDNEMQPGYKYDLSECQFSNLVDSDKQCGTKDNKNKHDNDSESEMIKRNSNVFADASVKNNIDITGSNRADPCDVTDQCSIGVGDESFLCDDDDKDEDDLTYEDFDQIEQFLSMNGHISSVSAVDSKDVTSKAVPASRRSPRVQTLVSTVSGGHAENSLSTSVLSVCSSTTTTTTTTTAAKSSIITSSVLSIASSSVLQSPSSSSPSSSSSSSSRSATTASSVLSITSSSLLQSPSSSSSPLSLPSSSETTTSSVLSIASSSSSSSSSSPSSSATTTMSSMTRPVPSTASTLSVHHKSFQYSCSHHTGRIYLYNERGQSLKVNFLPIDLEMDNTDKLPEYLQQPHHYRLLQRFVREWMSLSATQRRVIAKKGVLFERPFLAYESVRSVHGSTTRHLVKESVSAASEKAATIQGRVRLIHRPNQAGMTTVTTTDEGREGNKGTAQVVTSEGIPLCLQCHEPYSNPLLPQRVITRPQNAWQLRLCSQACMDKYWTLKHAGYLREQILEVERGICRLCQFDAQGFYSRMKCTKDVRQRAEMVNQSPYSKLGHKARARLVTQVLAGQFWHVDHIVPVWRGGGMCDLDNLRTLCTPCHVKVTRDQAGQRAKVKKMSSAVSSGDITAFFQKM